MNSSSVELEQPNSMRLCSIETWLSPLKTSQNESKDFI